jgi:hypothetical protein
MRIHGVFQFLLASMIFLFVPSALRDGTGHFHLRLGTAACAQGTSLKDVSISSDPPADEQEDSDFPGGNPIEFFDAYSWRLFIALNWPAKEAQRGVPDLTKDPSDVSSPRVWETWKSPSDLIPPQRNPDNELPEWASFEAVPVCPEDTGSARPTIKTLTFGKLGSVIEDFNQLDSTGFAVGSVVAQNRTYVRYEIRMNEKEFTKIRNDKLYLRKTLEDMQNQGKSIVFPDQSIEVKAAWREFKLPDEAALLSRYYHVEARAFSPESNTCETKTFGLIGFHIAQKTKRRRQWTWSTFEHVDNLALAAGAPIATLPTLKEAASDAEASIPDGGITQGNPPKTNPNATFVRRLRLNPQNDAIPSTSTAATNAKWQNDPKIKNTVWKNYQLVMAQWPTMENNDAGTGAPFPSRNVANITMETYRDLQESSCIQCHFPTASGTDFVWFLSLRAFAPQPLLAGPSSFFAPPGKPKELIGKEKEFIEKLRRAAAKAKQVEEKP